MTDGSEIMLTGQRPYNGDAPVKITNTFDVDSDLRIIIDGDAPDRIQMVVLSRTGAVLEYSTRDGGVNTPSDSANPGMVAVGAVDVTHNRDISPYSSQGQHPPHDGNSGRYKPDIWRRA